MKKKAAYPFLLALDSGMFLALALALLILVSGGTEFYWQKHLIKVYSANNLLLFITFLLPLRMLAADLIPLFGITALSTKNIGEKSYSFCVGFYEKLINLRREQVLRILLAIIVVSAAIKIANAWFYYGFISGDDVEIHEMTFARLFQQQWPVWDIRNAFYPMVFIYPAQALLKSLGYQDPQILVFAGRMVVMLFSSLSIYLVYKAAGEITASIHVGLLAAFFFAFSKLHVTFAGSELPRTVASSFILLSFWLLLKNRENAWFVWLSGIFLGIAASTRFSEAFFIVPCTILLLIEKRFRHAVLILFSFALSFFFVLGISDWLYWKKAFFSLINIVDFTLVKKLSSRGYQPFYYYLSDFLKWTNIFVVTMVAFTFKMKKWRVLIWVLLPLGLLSLLPHKEPRYLIPIIPFMAILTAMALFQFLKNVPVKKTTPLDGKTCKMAALLLFLFATSMLFEIDGFRFRRNETAVDIARYLAAHRPRGVVALEDIWHFGGNIYLADVPNIRNISSADLAHPEDVKDLLNHDNLEYLAMQNQTLIRSGYEEIIEKSGFSEMMASPGKEYRRFRLFKKKH
jgi:hypothetical protein